MTLDVLADSSHTPSVRRGYVALLLGGILLPLAACTSGTPCNSWKCGGPGTLPPFAVHMAIDGKRVAMSSHRTPIKIGRPVRIEVYLDRSSGVDVKNVYLFVSSEPWTFAARPLGRIKILTHHVFSVPQRQPVTARWTPEPLFGARQLDVSVTFEMAGAGIGPTVGQLQLVP
jgi:hypothetical protein